MMQRRVYFSCVYDFFILHWLNIWFFSEEFLDYLKTPKEGVEGNNGGDRGDSEEDSQSSTSESENGEED